MFRFSNWFISLMLIITTLINAQMANAINLDSTCPFPFRNINLGPGKLDLGGSFRLRYEGFDNYNIKTYGNDKTDTILLSRLRIDSKYQLPHRTQIFVQLQDAHFVFSDLNSDDFGPSCPYENVLDFRQGFLEMKQIASTSVGFCAGRQVIKYGDYRIFGPGDWGNVGRYTWDAGKVLIDTSQVQIDFFAANRVLYVKNSFDDSHFPYHVYAAYARIHAIPDNKLDLFYVIKHNPDKVNRGAAGAGSLLVQTVGFYWRGTWKSLDYKGTFAYQYGDYSQDNIRAFGFNVESGYNISTMWEPRLAFSLTYASGDKGTQDKTYETFDGVFGAVDKYYGRMNLFSWMNLIDIQMGVSVKPIRKMKLSLEFHRFKLAQAKDAWYYCTGKKMRWDPTGKSGRNLGYEIDLIWKYEVHRYMTLMAGCCAFFPGQFIEMTGASENAYWAFGQVLLRF